MRLLAALIAALAVSQAPHAAFSIHKYQMKVGEEAQGAFTLSYLGSPVKLQWNLELAADGTPKRFSAKGDTSTQSHVDYEVGVEGNTITLRDGQKTSTVPKPERFVINAGYAPIVLQEEALKDLARARQAIGNTRVPGGADSDRASGSRYVHAQRQIAQPRPLHLQWIHVGTAGGLGPWRFTGRHCRRGCRVRSVRSRGSRIRTAAPRVRRAIG